MTAKTKSWLRIAFVVLCSGLPVLAAATCLCQWRNYDQAKTEFTQTSIQQGFPEGMADQSQQISMETESLSTEISAARQKLGQLQKQLMPLNCEQSRRQLLDMLDLAARCGLDVVEVTPMDDDAKSLARAAGVPEKTVAESRSHRYGAAAFLNGFPRNARRPLVRLRCRAQYPAIHKFFNETRNLKWCVTPVLFDMHDASVAVVKTSDSDDEYYATPEASPKIEKSDSLRLTIIMAL